MGGLPLCIDADELEFLPASIYYVFDAQVELAAHHTSVRFSR